MIFVLLALFPLSFAQSGYQPVKLGSVTVSGSFRARMEAWDWFEGEGGNSYVYSGNIFRFSFAQTTRRYDWQLEFAAPILLGLPDDAVAPGAQGALGLGANYYTANNRARNAAMIFPKQGFFRLKGLFGDDGQSLRVGRFEFADGAEITPKDPSLAAVKRDRISQRLIGPFGWSHVGRSFDGVHYIAARPKLNFQLVAAMPTRGAFQVDGWNHLDVAFAYASLSAPYQRKSCSGDWRLFGIYYQDWRRVLKTDNRPLDLRRADLANIRIGSFGGHWLHASGPVDLLFWGVLQTGRWGRLDHRAAAGAAEAGWQPRTVPRLRPWLRAGYYRGSGDGDANDNTHNTFFQVLPTPRPYARFPFFDLMNNQDLFGAVWLRPHKSITLKPEVRWLHLSQRDDLWVQGGGAFQPWSFGYIGRPSGGRTGLATLYDVSADWNVNARVAITAYYGFAAGGDVIRSVYPRGENGSLGYLEVTYRF